MEKKDYFNKEYNYIKDSKKREDLKYLVNNLPDYFFEIPASSTGKYHPEFASTTHGLVKHTKLAVRIAYELLDNPGLNNFNDNEKDIIIMALILHDGFKSGKVQEKYTRFDHPLLVCDFIREHSSNLSLTSDEIDLLTNVISSHMGIWNKDYNGNEVLPIPKDKYQRFVHMCDYLSSKKFMNINFDGIEIKE
ncbi:MAG: HD domain-containing protein [Bacilli bacterium]